MKFFVGAIAVLSVFVGAGYWPEISKRHVASAASGAVSRTTASDYLTAELVIGRIQRTITATGSLQAVSTVQVSSQLSGQIATLQADFNDSVIAGQPLAELDQRGYRARVDQAEAELNMARKNVAILVAKLEKALGVEQEALSQRKIHRARIDQARVKLNAAKRQLTRTEILAKRGTKSRAAVDEARSARDTAAPGLREAEAEAESHKHVVAVSRAGRREAEAELANARAALPLRRAALLLARLDLDRSTIRAPIDGVIVQRNVEKGQTVAVSLDAPVLFTIAGDLSAMEIHANIDETDIGEIAIDQRAQFTVDAYPGREFPARVTEIRKAARINQGVVSYTVVLRVINPHGLLLPGMTANVNIVVKKIGPTRILPLAALRFTPSDKIPNADTGTNPVSNSGTRTVWVLEPGGVLQRHSVRLGVDDGRDVAVIGGDVRQGDRVVTGRVPRPAKTNLFGIRF